VTPRDHDDVGTLLAERLGTGESKPRRRAEDKGGATLEPKIHRD
jgi:hypothetical protein